jgi:hypothetical protein
MKYTTLLPTLLLSASTLTAASPCTPNYTTTITASQVEAIAPKSSSCENPEEIAPQECATAAQAAPALSAAFKKYNLTSRAEQAAVIALSAFESGEYRFSRNHFPGVEGQGSTYSSFLTGSERDANMDVNSTKYAISCFQ